MRRFLGRVAKLWVILAFVVIAIYFTVFNQERVHIRMPPWIQQVSVPLFVVEMAFFGAGAMVMTIYFGLESLKKSLEIRRLTKRLKELDPTFDELPATSPTSGGDDAAGRGRPSHSDSPYHEVDP